MAVATSKSRDLTTFVGGLLLRLLAEREIGRTPASSSSRKLMTDSTGGCKRATHCSLFQLAAGLTGSQAGNWSGLHPLAADEVCLVDVAGKRGRGAALVKEAPECRRGKTAAKTCERKCR